ncbi:bifunctional diaminohydroxyphosphoribosylaminopyrimidine deaminase/5-amino-6-(5-phosphoribosylamino)uracil reductase RibD [Acetobacteraceae bacterium ESL0709]|nr:bifunctional diaminohydroxyphosphoribosylaminopyrimidine deaminase/5-amino-6-(5-phosphoribosylamino)uracil reductase RibD [Acetobacteraceae bacterium ESL0697]MDF7678983.1 bifunctional diaminohydroxyphosphoribosylaminopyrimidine deaminase/5-amino-6-(5-phosphoribosylamino)uracil reductase RibD [Acetobacteraceae bacterium ESL0709]
MTETGRSFLPHEAIKNGFRLALNEAADTLGATAPNPSVGCALLDCKGKILAVGAHPKAGAPHAEIVALEKARQAGLYDRIYAALVTLEPCAHYGRTPPCAEKLRESPAQEIWIGVRDPNPQAAGGGKLLSQGAFPKKVFFLEELQVEDADWNSLFQDCRALALPFLTRVEKKRPWVTVKQALTLQGSMIPSQGQTTFTTLASLKQAHRLRRSVDAIITGIGTVLADYPSFTVRHEEDHVGRRPRLLIVMDRHGLVPRKWKAERERDHFIVQSCSALKEAEELMNKAGVNWAMIEAGPALLKSVEEEHFWDEWWIIQQQASGNSDQSIVKMRDGNLRNESPLEFSLRHMRKDY